MKLLFKQRMFSWWSSYDIFDESEQVVYRVEGQAALGHKLHILDAQDRHIATLKGGPVFFNAKFDLFIGEERIGCVRQHFTFFKPKFSVELDTPWELEGSVMGWDYLLRDGQGNVVAEISKEIFRLTDTYVMDIADPENALKVLMVVLAIDAEKASRG